MSALLDQPSDLTQTRLEIAIRTAMQKTSSEKEADLCNHIPHLTPTLYLAMKNNDQNTLLNLIENHILNPIPRTKTATNHFPSQDLPKSLDEYIEKAMQIIKARKESDLCKYIPDENGYMHHFTYKYIKRESPKRLLYLIMQNFFDKEPVLYPPKPRKKYNRKKVTSEHFEVSDSLQEKASLSGSSKSIEEHFLPASDSFFSKEECIKSDVVNSRIESLEEKVERLCNSVADLRELVCEKLQVTGENKTQSTNEDVILHVLQMQLIKSISQGRVDVNLWKAYVSVAYN